MTEKIKTVRIHGEDRIMQRHGTMRLQDHGYDGIWTLVYFDSEEAIFLRVREVLSILNDGTMTKKHLTDHELDCLYKMTYLVFGT